MFVNSGMDYWGTDKDNDFLCRLDFANFVLAQPEVTDNKCKDDMFIVTGGPPVPSICGVNTGSHSQKYFSRGNIFTRNIFILSTYYRE